MPTETIIVTMQNFIIAQDLAGLRKYCQKLLNIQKDFATKGFQIVRQTVVLDALLPTAVNAAGSDMSIIKVIYQSGATLKAGQHALLQALELNKIDVVFALLDCGVRIDSNFMTGSEFANYTEAQKKVLPAEIELLKALTALRIPQGSLQNLLSSQEKTILTHLLMCALSDPKVLGDFINSIIQKNKANPFSEKQWNLFFSSLKQLPVDCCKFIEMDALLNYRYIPLSASRHLSETVILSDAEQATVKNKALEFSKKILNELKKLNDDDDDDQEDKIADLAWYFQYQPNLVPSHDDVAKEERVKTLLNRLDKDYQFEFIISHGGQFFQTPVNPEKIKQAVLLFKQACSTTLLSDSWVEVSDHSEQRLVFEVSGFFQPHPLLRDLMGKPDSWKLYPILTKYTAQKTEFNIGAELTGLGDNCWLNYDLYHAIDTDNFALCRLLLAVPNINIFENKNGDLSPVTRAFKSDKLEMLKLLLASRPLNSSEIINLNREIYNHGYLDTFEALKILLSTPGVQLSCWREYHLQYLSYSQIFEILLAAPEMSSSDKCRLLDFALFSAARDGSQDIAELLIIARETDVNANNPPHEAPHLAAVWHQHQAILNLIFTLPRIKIDTKNKEIALLLATENNSVEVVKLLLTTPGIDINAPHALKKTALITATEKNSVEIIKLLLATPGIDINARDLLQQTALIKATENNSVEIVKLLLATPGIDINAQDSLQKTALIRATENDSVAIFKLLLATPGIDINAKDSQQDTALIWAVRNRNTKNVELLLATPGIDINARNLQQKNALSYAISYGDKSMMGLLLNTPGIQVDQALIFLAIEKNNTEIIKLLLPHIINVNAKNRSEETTLIFAARNNCINSVELLLATPGIDINAKDVSGKTALICAASNNCINSVELLLATPGIDINAMDFRNNTALSLAILRDYTNIINLLLKTSGIRVDEALFFSAIKENRANIVKLLLPHVKNINVVNPQQDTALICAARNNNVNIVEFLLAIPGININAKNLQGESALSIALQNGNRRVMRLLLTHPLIGPIEIINLFLNKKFSKKINDYFLTPLNTGNGDRYSALADLMWVINEIVDRSFLVTESKIQQRLSNILALDVEVFQKFIVAITNDPHTNPFTLAQWQTLSKLILNVCNEQTLATMQLIEARQVLKKYHHPKETIQIASPKNVGQVLATLQGTAVSTSSSATSSSTVTSNVLSEEDKTKMREGIKLEFEQFFKDVEFTQDDLKALTALCIQEPPSLPEEFKSYCDLKEKAILFCKAHGSNIHIYLKHPLTLFNGKDESLAPIAFTHLQELLKAQLQRIELKSPVQAVMPPEARAHVAESPARLLAQFGMMPGVPLDEPALANMPAVPQDEPEVPRQLVAEPSQ